MMKLRKQNAKRAAGYSFFLISISGSQFFDINLPADDRGLQQRDCTPGTIVAPAIRTCRPANVS
jgi:hypothetical protein